MWINIIIYALEIVFMLAVIITGIIFFKKTNKKDMAIFLGIALPLFFLIPIFTYIFEIPEIKIPKTVSIEVNSGEKLIKPEAFYHFKNISNEIIMYGEIDYSKTGEYEINIETDTLLGIYSKKIIVKIQDTKNPDIVLEGDEEYSYKYTSEYEEPGFKAIDEYEGDITNRVKISKEEIDKKTYSLIYEVSDSSGNLTRKVRKVNIIDDIAPTLTLNGVNNKIVFLGEEYIEDGAVASDEFDGDLTNNIEIIGNVDTSNEGEYVITYKVSDTSLNETSKKRVVVVAKKEDIVLPEDNNGQVGIIYLTFDDGPSTNITPAILDILKEKNVKATFFVLNYDADKEEIIKREYEEGHTIGIHGYSHELNAIYQSEDVYMENITKLQNKIKETTGYTSTITRFPGGSSNTISDFNPGIMTRLSKLVLEKGYKYFDWNVSAEDAKGERIPEDMYNNVINYLKSGERNVVLMHDFGRNEELLEILPSIIDYGKQNGYVFEKISEDTPMITHKVFN